MISLRWLWIIGWAVTGAVLTYILFDRRAGDHD